MKLKETLNLPKTSFPMKLDKGVEARLMASVSARRRYDPDAPQFVLHDGPPFANGDIHLGHAINKVIKDITNRLAAQKGQESLFRPGWDCHGLPIENQVKDGYKGANDVVSFRTACAAFAQGWIDRQKESFMRLGVRAAWEDPYTTMSPEYEANVMRAFGTLVEHGLVYRKQKPVHWSIENQTAMAVGELEYKSVKTDSIYLGFRQYTTWPENKGCQFLVWTTTPWTLPANMHLAVNPQAEYVRVKYQGKMYILAAARLDAVLPGAEVIERIAGSYVAGMLYVAPFDEEDFTNLVNTQRILTADWVSTETGTGIVHIAGAHGLDDYNLCEKAGARYMRTPVQADGTFGNSAPEFLCGKNIFDAQKDIIEYQRQHGRLHSVVPIEHDYPHDWRSHKPVITRETEQWFISMDKEFGEEKMTLREKAIVACKDVEFVPSSAKNRFISMLKSRPDWCISRQRNWGLPIPAFYDENGKALVSSRAVQLIASEIAIHGSNYWYQAKAEDLINDPLHRPLRKETDTFDVWFESGASFLSAWSRFREQPDVYIEGTDQHRGWFQHSLLLSVALRGRAPFRKVVTHGFVVKPDGTKVSKSDPEYVKANETMDKLGVDPIRLWIASNDFQQDICASPKMLEEFTSKYNKVRNTIKFLISNLYDYDPSADFNSPNTSSLDMWMVNRVYELEKNYNQAVESFAYHTAVAHIFNFINVDLSAVYANAMKDRLYCGGQDSPERRKTQTVLCHVLIKLLEMLEPIIPYTVAEVREHFPYTTMPSITRIVDHSTLSVLFKLREMAIVQLDELKKSFGMNKATDAEIVYVVNEQMARALAPYGDDLEDIVGCGEYTFEESDSGFSSVRVVDHRADYKVCQRSWKRRHDVAEVNGMALSERDRAVIAQFIDPIEP